MRLPPTPCLVCFRPCVFNKVSHFLAINLPSPPINQLQQIYIYITYAHLIPTRYRKMHITGLFSLYEPQTTPQKLF